jgi:hypothetical protein
MLERGKLARRIGANGEEYVCLVLSLDPPTRCCAWEPCSHKKPNRCAYTPMAKVVWQTGMYSGQEKIIMARLLECVD